MKVLCGLALVGLAVSGPALASVGVSKAPQQELASFSQNVVIQLQHELAVPSLVSYMSVLVTGVPGTTFELHARSSDGSSFVIDEGILPASGMYGYQVSFKHGRVQRPGPDVRGQIWTKSSMPVSARVKLGGQ